MRHRLALALALLGACATEPALQRTPPLAIERVAIEPKELKLDQSATTTLRFELSQAARVTVEIQDEAGTAVQRLELGQQPAGVVEVPWDGRSLEGARVPSGVYLYRIAARAAGSEVVAEPLVPGGGEVLAQRFTFDRDTGTMRFGLPQASRVRLRIGLRGYPLLRTLHDWTPMLAGEHEVTWDGRDVTGLIQVDEHAKLDINLSAFALPGNAILVTGNGPLERRAPGAPAGMVAGAYRHAIHPSEICREPRLRVEFVGARKGRNGLPVVSGVAPVRLTLDPADAAHLVGTHFELMLFLDSVFLTESESGSNPFNYSLDTRALAPGPHLFTVNVLGYDDHFGTHTIQFERGAE